MSVKAKLLYFLSITSLGLAEIKKGPLNIGPINYEIHGADSQAVRDALSESSTHDAAANIKAGNTVILDLEITVASNISAPNYAVSGEDTNMQLMALSMTPSREATQAENNTQEICLQILGGFSAAVEEKQLKHGSGECVGVSGKCRKAWESARGIPSKGLRCDFPSGPLDLEECKGEFDLPSTVATERKIPNGTELFSSMYSTPEIKGSEASVADFTALSRKVWAVLLNDIVDEDATGPRPRHSITCMVASKDEGDAPADDKTKENDSQDISTEEAEEENPGGEGNSAMRASSSNAINLGVSLTIAIILSTMM
ncbi:hypothetical protein HJFPF1_10823 [Paramyrothecium foliicola]|nr:hypothetical protein HJFPF1_10823 [Paramyrothecium foliicola]